MSQKKRKYQDNYLDFRFTYLIEDDLQIPQCVVCMKTFSNSTMKPASLKQHLANARKKDRKKDFNDAGLLFPPDPIITNKATWLRAALCYNENFPAVRTTVNN